MNIYFIFFTLLLTLITFSLLHNLYSLMLTLFIRIPGQVDPGIVVSVDGLAEVDCVLQLLPAKLMDLNLSIGCEAWLIYMLWLLYWHTLALLCPNSEASWEGRSRCRILEGSRREGCTYRGSGGQSPGHGSRRLIWAALFDPRQTGGRGCGCLSFQLFNIPLWFGHLRSAVENSSITAQNQAIRGAVESMPL